MQITFKPASFILAGSQSSVGQNLAFGANKADSVSFSGNAATLPAINLQLRTKISQHVLSNLPESVAESLKTVTCLFNQVLTASDKERAETAQAFNSAWQQLRKDWNKDYSHISPLELVFPNKMNLEDKNLSGLDLSDTVLPRANLKGAQLLGTDFENANLNEAQLSHANLTRCNLRNAQLCSTDFTGATLEHARLQEAQLHQTTFTNANLAYADLSNTRAYKAKFNNATMTGVDLNSFVPNLCEFEGAKGIWELGNGNQEFAGFRVLALAVWDPENLILRKPSGLKVYWQNSQTGTKPTVAGFKSWMNETFTGDFVTLRSPYEKIYNNLETINLAVKGSQGNLNDPSLPTATLFTQ